MSENRPPRLFYWELKIGPVYWRLVIGRPKSLEEVYKSEDSK